MVSQANSQPIMGAAMAGWTSMLTFIKVTQSVIDGIVTDLRTPVRFQGVVQPLSDRKLYLKPEGQRSWTWLQVHAAVAPSCKVDLLPNDRIEWNGKIFKVMSEFDYSQNGFWEYHLVGDFQNKGDSPK